MAVYTRTSGRASLPPHDGGNLPSTQSSNLPVESKQEPIASKEIGEIIIHSMETVTEALEGKDVPVNAEQIEKSVTGGINKSVIAKKENLPSNTKGNQIANGSSADRAMADYWRQKQYIDWKKEQEREEKLEDESRKQRDAAWNEKVDKFFAGMNAFSNNPLKGFSDLLDKGVKGLFKGVGKTMDKTVGEIGSDVKAEAGKVLAPVKTAGTLIGAGLKTAGKGIMYGVAGASLIKDKMTVGKQQSATSEITKLINEDERTEAKPAEVEKPEKPEEKTKSEVQKQTPEDKPLRAEVEKPEKPEEKKVEPVVEKPESQVKDFVRTEQEIAKSEEKTQTVEKAKPEQKFSFFDKLFGNKQKEENLPVHVETEKESATESIKQNVSEENEPRQAILALPAPSVKGNTEEQTEEQKPEKSEQIEPEQKDVNDTNELALEENKQEAELGELIKADDEEEAEANEDRDETNEQLGNLVKQGDDAAKFQTIKLGLIIAAVSGIAAAIPGIVGAGGKLINNLPFYFDDIKIKIGLLLDGPNSIFNQISRAIKASLANLANLEGDDMISKALRGIGEKFAYGADEELLQKQATAKQNVYDKITDLGYDGETAKYVVQNFNDKGAKKYNIADFSNDTGFDVSEAFQNKSDKKEYKNKFKNKPLAEWDKSDLMWFKSRLPPEKYAEVEKAYETGVALTELANVNEEVKNSKGNLINYKEQGQEAKKAELVEFQKRQAERRIEKYQSGQISSADLMTDKSWTENPELVKFVAESGPDFFNNLKQNSKGEQLTQDGLEYLEAIKKTFGDIAKDFTGNSNKWSESDQNNALNRLRQVNETRFGVTVNSPGTSGSAFMCN